MGVGEFWLVVWLEKELRNVSEEFQSLKGEVYACFRMNHTLNMLNNERPRKLCSCPR